MTFALKMKNSLLPGRARIEKEAIREALCLPPMIVYCISLQVPSELEMTGRQLHLVRLFIGHVLHTMKSLEGHTRAQYLKMMDGAAMVYNLFAQTKRFAQKFAIILSIS